MVIHGLWVLGFFMAMRSRVLDPCPMPVVPNKMKKHRKVFSKWVFILAPSLAWNLLFRKKCGK
jgi:hypothetical protein